MAGKRGLLAAAGGVAVGARLLPRLPLPWLKAAFGLLLLWAAWRLLFR